MLLRSLSTFYMHFDRFVGSPDQVPLQSRADRRSIHRVEYNNGHDANAADNLGILVSVGYVPTALTIC